MKRTGRRKGFALIQHRVQSWGAASPIVNYQGFRFLPSLSEIKNSYYYNIGFSEAKAMFKQKLARNVETNLPCKGDLNDL